MTYCSDICIKNSCSKTAVPTIFQNQFLQTGHDSMFVGYLGCVKTLACIQLQFHWPEIVGISGSRFDLVIYARRCLKMVLLNVHLCKNPFFPNVRFRKSLLISWTRYTMLPLEDTVSFFLHWYMISLSRNSDFKMRYIWRCRRSSARGFLQGFWTGFPDIILSDNSTQFVSRIMRSFTDILFIAQTFRSPYHLFSNGIV